MVNDSPLAGPLPPNANLEFYRKAARALLDAAQAGDEQAIERLKNVGDRTSESYQLSDAQLAVARELGFPSWPRLKAHFDSLPGSWSRPYERRLEWYSDRADGLVTVHKDGPADVLEQIRRFHPAFAGADDQTIRDAPFTLDDARLVVAREHGSPDWEAFSRHIQDLASGKSSDAFLTAFEALQAGDIRAFEAAVESDPSVIRALGSNGNSLLNLASSIGRMDAVRLLLQRGADVNAGNRYGWTALHQAGYSNNLELTRLCLDAGADPNLFARGDGGTALVMALFWGNVEAADLLAGAGVLPDNLRVAAGLGLLERIESFFEPDGKLKANAGSHRGFYRPHGGFPQWTPSDDPQEILDEAFVYACKCGRVPAMERLLQKGARIDADPYRGTGLIWAAVKNRFEAVAWLLEHGADVNQKATFGGSSHGVGVTALHLVSQSGAMEMIRYLLERGADPNMRDDLYHSAPWGWAREFDKSEAAELLLQRAAPVDIDAAVQLNDLSAVRQHLQRSPELVNHRNPPGEGASPLERAARCGYRDMVAFLLTAGADPTQLDSEGKTAAERADEQGHSDVAALIRSPDR